jgi:hypothetical protein
VEAELTDNYVQVPPNSSGSKIDTSELVVNGNTVERQRIVLADPLQAGNLLSVGADGSISTSATDGDVQYLILAQLKRIATLLELLADAHVSADHSW